MRRRGVRAVPPPVLSRTLLACYALTAATRLTSVAHLAERRHAGAAVFPRPGPGV